VVPSKRVPPDENNVATWLPVESLSTTWLPLTVHAETDAASPGQPRDAARKPPDHLVFAMNIWQDEPAVVTFQAPTSASSETAGPPAEATCVPAGVAGRFDVVAVAGAVGLAGAFGNSAEAELAAEPTGASVPCCTVPAGAAGNGAGACWVDTESSRAELQPTSKAAPIDTTQSDKTGLMFPIPYWFCGAVLLRPKA
jgi:hypothetical protein